MDIFEVLCALSDSRMKLEISILIINKVDIIINLNNLFLLFIIILTNIN